MLRSLLTWILYRLGADPRGLFSFHDGRRWRYVDPMEAARTLWSLPGFESDKSRELIASGVGTLMAQGFAEIATAVRSVFDVAPASQGGLTELECRELLDRFEFYLGAVKKNGSPGRISSDATETQQSFQVPDVSGTKLVSGSGLTSDASNSASPVM